MTRLGTCASSLLLAGLAGCAAVVQTDPVPVGADFAPATACAAQVKVPQIVATSPAAFPDSVWGRKTNWEVQMRFRLDDQGVPREVRATVQPFDPDRDALENAATAALERYRFCRPVEFSTQTDWRARMRFTPAPIDEKTASGQMIVQLFLPAYTREEVSAGRKGTNKVVGTFGQDGHPTSVRLAASSGDAVLDHKSLEAIASYQLVFHPGTVLKHPLTYEQPYSYEIR